MRDSARPDRRAFCIGVDRRLLMREWAGMREPQGSHHNRDHFITIILLSILLLFFWILFSGDITGK